jgi:hypothetical protein
MIIWIMCDSIALYVWELRWRGLWFYNILILRNINVYGQMILLFEM